MGIFDNARSVVINNKIVNSITTSDDGVIYQNQWSTSLTIDVPLNLIYSDAFNITGTLKDRRNNLLIGETVKLKVGSVVVDTTTTNSNGEYSFTQTPVHTGNHSFQVVYDGSLSYDGCESAIVNRIVGKETTVITDQSYYISSGALRLRSLLTDDDGTPLAGKKVIIRRKLVGGEESDYTYGNTNNGGVFPLFPADITDSSEYVRFVFDGDDNFAGCSLVVPYDPPVPTLLTIDSDKDILSSYDEESCTVTCTVLDQNGTVMSGVSLDYSVEHDGTVIDSGTDTTDSNGAIDVSYSATGVGDVTFTFEYGNLLQETYEVWDMGVLFNPPLDGTDSITKWTNMTNKTENGVFYTHGSFLTDGWSNEGLWILDFDVSCPSWRYVGLMPICSAEINPFTDAKNTSYAYTTWERINYGAGFNSSFVSQEGSPNITDRNWHHYHIEKLSSTQLKVVIDSTYTAIVNVPNMVNHSILHIGSRDNPSSRNTGGIVELKNILVQG